MSAIVKIENLEELLIELRGENILLDADVAVIYGVETKRVNEAIKNNPDKFPQGYMFELDEVEFSDLRSKISTAKFAKTRVVPKAFTEKGLYMLATILKSQQATQATISIVETFSKIRELTRNIKELLMIQDKAELKPFMQKSDTESSIKLNFSRRLHSSVESARNALKNYRT